MASEPIVVLKFGSSVLRTPADLPWAVQEIYAHVRRGERVVAVVSAFAGVTDSLAAEARALRLDGHATAAHVAGGELDAASRLAEALADCGVPASRLVPRDVGLVTRGAPGDAEPLGLDARAFERALAARPVVVFPGFCGVDDAGRATLLGRGGSDLTALFVAERLGGRCTLLKDVDGLYERDPALPGPRPQRYAAASWEDALRVGGRVVQPKALRHARLHGLSLEVRAIGAPRGTHVGPQPSRLEPAPPARPLRVALLGLGVVGGGVYERLRARPDLFEIVAIAVRDPAKHAARGVPPALLTRSPWAALASQPDVVVEALGGVEPAASLVLVALLDGRRVVSANKAALAARHDAFAPFLGEDARLACAAAVGGAVPMLETVARLAARAPLARLRGVVNGTCNFVLDRLEAGVELAAAVAEAQAAGYAEADPTADLSGRDAAAKLELLAHRARGTAPAVRASGIDATTPARQREAAAAGRRLRLVATLDDAGARVALDALAPDDPLADAAGAENRLEISLADGTRHVIAGLGAGREPTATAVVADLLDAVAATPATPAAATARAAGAGGA